MFYSNGFTLTSIHTSLQKTQFQICKVTTTSQRGKSRFPHAFNYFSMVQFRQEAKTPLKLWLLIVNGSNGLLNNGAFVPIFFVFLFCSLQGCRSQIPCSNCCLSADAKPRHFYCGEGEIVPCVLDSFARSKMCISNKKITPVCIAVQP